MKDLQKEPRIAEVLKLVKQEKKTPLSKSLS